jgi:hypothetical protein
MVEYKHCKEDSNTVCTVFPEIKLRGLVPNYYVYIPEVRPKNGRSRAAPARSVVKGIVSRDG